MRLYRPASLPPGIPEVPARARQGEPEYGPARLIRFCPQTAPMGRDDGAANREPHADSARLRGVERLEHPLEMICVYPGTGVPHRHEEVIGLVFLGADR